VLIRVGRASTTEEIAAWPDSEFQRNFTSWIRIVDLVLDPTERAYRRRRRRRRRRRQQQPQQQQLQEHL